MAPDWQHGQDTALFNTYFIRRSECNVSIIARISLDSLSVF